MIIITQHNKNHERKKVGLFFEKNDCFYNFFYKFKSNVKRERKFFLVPYNIRL
jgi:hypothetical protein